MRAGTTLDERFAGRDPVLWQKRGLLMLFVLGVASLLGAIITFVAHNWVYLSTVGKLGFLGAMLFAAAVAWLLTKMESSVSQSLGMLAQVLIGVWLAAAGQLYQVTGGVQDLLLTWAVLGLPFAMASKSYAHWALWVGVLALALISPVGDRLNVLGQSEESIRTYFAALVTSTAYVFAVWRSGAMWFRVLMAVATTMLLIATAIQAMDGFFGWDVMAYVLALATSGALAGWAWSRRDSLAELSSFGFVVLAIVVTVVLRMFLEIIEGFDIVSIILVFVLIFGGATYGLIRLFKLIRARISQMEDEVDGDMPWYMDGLIALGGFITALFVAALVGVFFGLTLGMEESVWTIMLVLGLLGFAGFLFLRRNAKNLFTKYMSGTLMIASGIAATVGLAGSTEDIIAAAILGLVLSLISLFAIRERVLETVSAVGIAASTMVIVEDILPYEDQAWFEIYALVMLGTLGVLALTRVISKHHFMAAGALWLVTTVAMGVSFGQSLGVTSGLLDSWPTSGWVVLARFGVALALVALAWFSEFKKTLPSVPILILLTAIAALLPAGGVGAYLLLLIGYAMGSKSLALIGAIVTGFFLFWAYFDLNLTLMELSGIMAVSGLVLLGVWKFAQGRAAREAVA